MAGDADGPFLDWIAKLADCSDSCSGLLRDGGELFGNLDSAGIGEESLAPLVEPLVFSRPVPLLSPFRASAFASLALRLCQGLQLGAQPEASRPARRRAPQHFAPSNDPRGRRERQDVCASVH